MDFREEVRSFLAAALSAAAVDGQADPSDLTGLSEAFERRLHRSAGSRGWLNLPPERQAVFNYEAARADAPLVDTAMTLAGPVVAAHGTGWQRDLLAQMAAGEVTMCIAYTEEAAGSDLSAVEAVASPRDDDDGGGWVLRGTKVLVTGAHKADWCCTVARTRLDVPAKRGLSMFLVDMRAPGVEVVRRPTMNGWTLDDVRFHDVALGPSALLGELDGGWRQLVSAVAAERSGMFWLGFARHVFDLLVDHVRHAKRDGAPLVEDPIARDTVARLAVDLAAAERLSRRTLWTYTHPEADAEVPPPALGAMAKVVVTELLQDIAQAATELAGHAGLAWAPPFAPPGSVPPGAAAGGRFAWEYLERVHGTISVGANELQRDVIAQAGLGLPRRDSPEPAPDPVLAPEVGARAPTSGARTQGSLTDSLTDLVAAARELGRAAAPSTFHTDVLARLLGWRGPGLAAVALDLTAGPDLETSGPTGAATAGAATPPTAATGHPSASGPSDHAGVGEVGVAGAAATPPTGAGSLVDEGGSPGLTVVSGVCDFVAHAAVADRVLVVVGEDRVVEVDVPGDGVEVEAQATIGGDDRGRITLDRAPVVAGWSCDVAGARARAAVVLAADAAGAAEGALDAAVAHVKERRQWGAPLGTLQAVQHRAADMLIDVTLAADAVLDAAGIADRAESTDTAEREVRLAAAYAKATAIERCRRVTAAAHQLGGGQGILADRPFHRWYRRVKAAEPELGDARHHRSTIAASLLDDV